MYAKDMVGYVHYWKQLHSEIIGFAPPTPIKLHEGFWLIINWQRDHACSISSGVGFDVSPDTTSEDDPEPYPYCGPTKSWPKPCFNPYRDVLLGDFVVPMTNIASLCGLVVLYRLLIYPLIAIMKLLL